MPYHHELTMSDETISQPRIKITWLIGTLVAFGLFVVIGNYSRIMNRNYSDYDQDRAGQRYETLAKVRHDENALIYPVDKEGHSTAEWVDQANGIIRIPIDEAMAKEVDTLKAQTAGVGPEIPGAVPAPPPAPASVATPPAPAAKTPATLSAAKPAPGAKPAATSSAKPASANAPASAPTAKTNPTNK